jgi:hypothetical protein
MYPSKDPSIIQISITHPDPAAEVTVVGTGDINLNPAVFDSSFVDILNHYEQVSKKGNAFSVLNDGRVLVNYDVEAVIDAYIDVAHSSNNSTVAAVFCIERDGVRILSSRAVHTKLPSQSDIGNISGVGSSLSDGKLKRGDIVGVCLASDNSGTIDIKTSSVVITGYP